MQNSHVSNILFAKSVKNRLQRRCFFCKFCKLFKKDFLQNTTWWLVDRSSHRRCYLRKGVPRNSAKFTGSTCARISFLIKVQAWGQSLFFNKVGLQLYYKRDSGRGVFVWILRNFLEHLFYRTLLGDCFCVKVRATFVDSRPLVRVWQVIKTSCHLWKSYTIRTLLYGVRYQRLWGSGWEKVWLTAQKFLHEFFRELNINFFWGFDFVVAIIVIFIIFAMIIIILIIIIIIIIITAIILFTLWSRYHISVLF